MIVTLRFKIPEDSEALQDCLSAHLYKGQIETWHTDVFRSHIKHDTPIELKGKDYILTQKDRDLLQYFIGKLVEHFEE
jgi:hypothetical protein